MSGSFCSLYREIHYIVTLLIVKGAGICSLFHEIHYIKIRYIEVWVYQNFYFPKWNFIHKITYSEQHFTLHFFRIFQFKDYNSLLRDLGIKQVFSDLLPSWLSRCKNKIVKISALAVHSEHTLSLEFWIWSHIAKTINIILWVSDSDMFLPFRHFWQTSSGSTHLQFMNLSLWTLIKFDKKSH